MMMSMALTLDSYGMSWRELAAEDKMEDITFISLLIDRDAKYSVTH